MMLGDFSYVNTSNYQGMAPLRGGLAALGSACGQQAAQQYNRPKGLELMAAQPLPSYSEQDAKLYRAEAKLANCRARRKAAIMKAAQVVGQPYL